MKKFLLIAGAVILVVLLGFGIWAGSTIFILYSIRSHARVLRADDFRPPGQKEAQVAAELAKPLLIDSNDYQTEDNWLATTISREVADMSLLAAHPDQSPRDLKVTAKVDPAKPSIHVEINGVTDGEPSPLVSDLTPVFVWDPAGYAPLARQLLSNTTGDSSVPDSDATDILTHLLTLTGSELALEDVRLSDTLQHHPASAQAHEAAALALVALALRENAAKFSDNRNLLNRATAHLAVAQALRGNQPATWPGLVADAAIRTLAGRELDALAQLDSLSTRTGCPPPAQTWITALKLLNKQDWRVADVTTASPLLLKIAWFQVLMNNLSDVAATHRLDQIVSRTGGANPAQAQSLADREKLVPDWGRAVGTGRNISVQGSEDFTAANMPLEMGELQEVLKIEDGETIDPDNLAATLSKTDNRTVSSDAQHQSVVHVIGAGAFKDATRHHLFNDIQLAYEGASRGLGLETQAQAFQAQMDVKFRGVPQYGLYGLHRQPSDPIDITELPPEVASGLHSLDLFKSFYHRGAPFGTAYDARQRSFATDDNSAQEMLKLAPDSYPLVTHGLMPDHLLPKAEPFFAYNSRPMIMIEDCYVPMSDEDREKMLASLVKLEPVYFFSLAALYRKTGRYDEAAAMDRKGFAEANDDVYRSNSVASLVDYDFTHDLKDEALSIAQQAAATGSEAGMSACMDLFARMGRYDEAEQLANAIRDRYNDNSSQRILYAMCRDHFPDKYAEAVRELFSNGLVEVQFSDFKDKPKKGCVVAGPARDLETDQLVVGDIIVALDGRKVESRDQYAFIRALSQDPHMDMVVWSKDKYVEVKLVAPNRRFHSQLEDGPIP